MPVPEAPGSKLNSLKTNGYSQLQLKGNVHENNFTITYEGLPKGSSPALVVRCIRLLEHVVSCSPGKGGCPEGEECSRTRQVLTHHLHCRAKLQCRVCRQLRALCRIHSDRCQIGEQSCAVPYCKNKKIPPVPKTTKVPTNSFNKHPNKKEYHYVLKKLSQTMEIPNKQERLQGIESLLETNRHATIQLLRYVVGKKQKPPQTISFSQQIRDPPAYFKPKGDIVSPKNDDVGPSKLFGLLKLDVVVRVSDKIQSLA